MIIEENSAQRVVLEATRSGVLLVFLLVFGLLCTGSLGLVLFRWTATKVAPRWAELSGVFERYQDLEQVAVVGIFLVWGLFVIWFATYGLLYNLNQRLNFDLAASMLTVAQCGVLRRADRSFPFDALDSGLTPAEDPKGRAHRIWSLKAQGPKWEVDLANEMGLTNGENEPTGYALTAAQAKALQPLLSALAKVHEPHSDALPA